jgi:hypothetical protein
MPDAQAPVLGGFELLFIQCHGIALSLSGRTLAGSAA